MKQKELDQEILKLAKEQKEHRLFFLEEKEWTIEETPNPTIIQELNNNDYLEINEQEISINLAEILMMINSSEQTINHQTDD